MKPKLELTQTWIGLIKVEQRDRTGPLGDSDQAYTNVVGLARNKRHFRNIVKGVLDELELYLLRLESAETLEQRLLKHSVHKRILRLASRLNEKNSIAFDVFAAFDKK